MDSGTLQRCKYKKKESTVFESEVFQSQPTPKSSMGHGIRSKEHRITYLHCSVLGEEQCEKKKKTYLAFNEVVTVRKACKGSQLAVDPVEKAPNEKKKFNVLCTILQG